MKNNFSSLLKEEMIKRFEQVVLEEIRKNSLLRERYSSEFNGLKMIIEEIKDEQSNIRKNIVDSRSELYSFVKNEVKKIDADLTHQFTHVSHQQRSVDNYLKKLEYELQHVTTKSDFDIHLQKFEQKVVDIEKSINSLSKSLREENHQNQDKLKSIFSELEKSCDSMINKLQDCFVNLNKEIEENKIDTIGVLREIHIYKKTTFIIERKIEDLYRKIHKLEEVCLKRA